VDTNGTPLQVSLTGGNRHDVTQLLPLVDALPAIRGTVGTPRRRPRILYADRGYDYDKYRRELRDRGITPKIARRGVAHGSGLGKKRWVAERGFSWLHQFKRLRPATRSAPTSTSDSCTSPAPSSAGANSRAGHSETRS
jgi:transposase